MTKNISRRGTMKLVAASAALPLVHIRTAGAAGKVSIGFWDHWVPGGNDVMQKQVNAWAEKNKVEATADFITGNGNKLSLTGAAETQAKAGHDAMTFYNWDVHNYADGLEPIDDVMTRLIAANGEPNKTCQYLAHKKQGWVAVPSSSGTQTKPPCARISWFKKQGLDLQAMYPVDKIKTKLADDWTWEAFVKYAIDLCPWHGREHQYGCNRHAWCAVPCVRRVADRQRRNDTAAVRCGASGAGVRAKTGESLSRGCGEL